MMIQFPYGDGHLNFEIDDNLHVDVVRARSETPLLNPAEVIAHAIENPSMTEPLSKLLLKRPAGKICIVISDSTRPVPSRIIIEPILRLISKLGIPDTDVQILIATGLHRKTNPQELKRILGKEILYKFDIINHVAEDEYSLAYLGDNSFGSPIYINKIYLEASFKIITGYVEPHFFAGFSGGRKSILPGVAGPETISANHSAKNIASPKARFGILKDNPIYEDAIDTVKRTEIKPDFMVNVCINPEHKITKVLAGSLQAYGELVQYQENLCFFKVEKPYDVVISGNGGYPLDMNLYQAVKSMVIGELGVKKGGTIITINECRDGVGQPKFEELINLGLKPQQLFDKVTSGEIHCKDQWEIQCCARALAHADVFVVSEMKASELGNIGLKYATTVESALTECLQKYGENPRILVLPDGPMILPKN